MKQYIHLVICTYACLGLLYIWQPETYLLSGLAYPDKWEKLSFTTQRTFPGRKKGYILGNPKHLVPPDSDTSCCVWHFTNSCYSFINWQHASKYEVLKATKKKKKEKKKKNC